MYTHACKIILIGRNRKIKEIKKLVSVEKRAQFIFLFNYKYTKQPNKHKLQQIFLLQLLFDKKKKLEVFRNIYIYIYIWVLHRPQ